jgi:O-antigen/teichoic acid export membrane protein
VSSTAPPAAPVAVSPAAAPAAAPPAAAPVAVPRTAASAPGAPPPLLRDALVTIIARLVLAVLIVGGDIVIARALGPAAKGRFALVLLYSQLAAVVLAWGMDSALAVAAGRDAGSARTGMANALWWSALVGGAAVVGSMLLYTGGTGHPTGPLAGLIPNLSVQQFLFGAVALPGETFFAIALFGLLGRRRMVPYNVIRVLRRGILVVLVIGLAILGTVDLDLALALNLVALALTCVCIAYVAWRDGIMGLRPSGELLREELDFGSRALPGSLAERLQFRADSFLLNIIVGVQATGIYSVTSGLAETLWYIPNSLGTVMFSRAVDPRADAAHVAAVLSRTTVATTVFLAIPTWLLGPRLVKIVYGRGFTDAGVALRWILPGIVAYSVVAVLSRYVVGRGRPGIGTLVLVAGLVVNVAANLILIPRFGIIGAAASSSISYTLTAVVTLAVFVRLSGRGLVETLVIQRSDVVALARMSRTVLERLRGRRVGPIHGLPGGEEQAAIVAGEREFGEDH